MIDKSALKARMLDLEHHELEHAIEHYDAFMKESQLDSREGHDRDEYAAARTANDMAHAFDHPVHEHEAKIEVIEHLDFGPSDVVEQGAVVSFGGRTFVVAVSTGRFTIDGVEVMGISIESPVYKKMAGLGAGDSFEMGGREITLDEVY